MIEPATHITTPAIESTSKSSVINSKPCARENAGPGVSWLMASGGGAVQES
jgi:hypothetical protein